MRPVPAEGPDPLHLLQEAGAVAMEHADFGAGTVMRVEADRITVLFEQVGYRTSSLATVREQALFTGARA